jgi:flavodoxin
MKSAVVFYSYDGSTRAAANVLAERIGADAFELEETRSRGRSPLAFMAAGFSASVGKSSRLKNRYALEMKKYDTVYIGTPIWAGKAAPAVNSFVRYGDFAGKNVVIFTVQADTESDKNASKGPDILKTKLEKKGAVVLKIARLHGAPPGKTAAESDLLKQIEAKL